MNIFKDQEKFMRACNQTTGSWNQDQFDLYVNLMNEEWKELEQAIQESNKLETLDALIDFIVVTTGAIHSLGVDADGAWTEVVRSNMSKIDAETGQVLKRHDGKVIKPPTYSPPNLSPYLK